MGIFHILIIWSNSIDKTDFIINDLKSHFEIRKIFKVHWDKNLFLENLKTFYAHSQKHLNKDEYHHVLLNKKNTCGDGDFIAVIFKDNNPLFETRITSSGTALVNVNVYDRKIKYRELSNIGYDIHASNDEWETNKDLTVLFELNITDFCNKYTVNDDRIEKYTKNAIGVDGFENIQQLFYLLNNTIQYCVLRNFECLPSEYTVEGHGDIDLLVENKNYISYLTQAKQINDEPYRVYHTIKINGDNVPFDFRHIGDNYYDALWESNILESRKKEKCFYIPNSENLYFSLLYHAYVQKPIVKQDYLPKLKQYAKAIELTFNDNPECAISSLDAFLMQYRYEYTRPLDKTVFYNCDNLKFSKYAFRFGELISRSEVRVDDCVYKTKVYQKENSYFKTATKYLIDREYKYLTELQSEPHFPKIIAYGELDAEFGFIEISKCEGINPIEFFKQPTHQHLHYIKSFVEEMLKAITILIKHNILHRDLIPQNILVSENEGKCSINIIDFGWAVDIGDKNAITPIELGGRYHEKNGYSDVYSLGVAATDIEKFHGTRYECRVGNLLRQTTSHNYNDIQSLIKKIEQIQQQLPITLKDKLSEWKFFVQNRYRKEFLFSLLPFQVAYKCRKLWQSVHKSHLLSQS